MRSCTAAWPARVRRRLWIAAQVAFVALAFGYAAYYLAGQWGDARAQRDLLRLRPWPILAATALVFATYALLVQLWRLVLERWGARLGFVEAARIWSVSNLGRFLPVRVAQIGAMMYMARERGVSAAAAAGSSLLNALINIAAGVLVAVALGGPALDRVHAGARGVGLLMVGLAVVGLVALPWLLPPAIRLAGRLARRELPAQPTMPASAIWITVAGNLAAWLLYGVAFQLFTRGVLGEAAGALPAYVAVYSGSYVLGYLAVFTPGGLVAREAALVAFMTALGMATLPQATLVALASRLWLTVLEIVPGLLFLAHGTVRRRPPLTSGDAPL